MARYALPPADSGVFRIAPAGDASPHDLPALAHAWLNALVRHSLIELRIEDGLGNIPLDDGTYIVSPGEEWAAACGAFQVNDDVPVTLVELDWRPETALPEKINNSYGPLDPPIHLFLSDEASGAPWPTYQMQFNSFAFDACMSAQVAKRQCEGLPPLDGADASCIDSFDRVPCYHDRGEAQHWDCVATSSTCVNGIWFPETDCPPPPCGD